MSSEPSGEAFVWIWLPGASEPVVAGRLEEAGGEATCSARTGGEALLVSGGYGSDGCGPRPGKNIHLAIDDMLAVKVQTRLSKPRS
jgi:hypothetical protein